MKKRIIIFSLILLLLFAFQGSTLFAEEGVEKPETNSSMGATFKEAGLGFTSVLLTVPYSALKVSYSTLGMVVGGLAYCITLGNVGIAKGIIDPACKGTYVITPKNLMAEEPVYFVGLSE